MFIILIVAMISQLYTGVNTYQVVHVKYVQFMCQLYLNKHILEKPAFKYEILAKIMSL